MSSSINGLEATRRKIVYGLLKKQFGDGATEKQLNEQVDYFLENLTRTDPIFKPKPQEEMTDARLINQELNEYQLDIHGLYSQLDSVDKLIVQHQKLNESIIEDIRIRTEKINQQIEEFDYAFRNERSVNVRYENFLDYNSKEKNYRLFTSRSGEILPLSNHLTIDTYQNSLKLPILFSEDKLINFNGVRLADINIIKQVGSGFIKTKNPAHGVEMAIDSSLETYWNESILTDVPMEINLGKGNYDLQHGATCIIELVLDYISSINEITLIPFSEYPLEVVAILIYDTDNVDADPYELVSPTATIKGKESTTVMSFQFQEIIAKRIRIILNQQHYTKRNIIVKSDAQDLLKVWLEEQGHIIDTKNKIFLPVEQNQMETAPHWYYLKDYMKNKNILKEINELTNYSTNQDIAVSKYEYQYGLYNINVMLNEYFHEGVFVTKSLSSRNTHLVQIEAIEEHPILEEIGIPISNIEYYVTDKEQPTDADWYPIMPVNKDRILSERLHPVLKGDAYYGPSRFEIDTLHAVRRNGEKMLAHEEFEISVDGIKILQYEPDKIYTIDYRPVPKAYSINFLDLYTKEEVVRNGNKIESVKAKKKIEEIQLVKDDNMITLARYPFVDKSQINQLEASGKIWDPTYLENDYLPIKVRLIAVDGSYIEQKTHAKEARTVSIENKTDYYDTNRNLLEIFTGQNYQYRVEDNQLIFNTKVPTGTIIMVEYPYLTDAIRMKIIMHRNLHDVYGLSPFLHEYKVITHSVL